MSKCRGERRALGISRALAALGASDAPSASRTQDAHEPSCIWSG